MKTHLNVLTGLFVAMVMCIAIITGCKKNSPETPPAPQQGTYNMFMTDAPADYQQVNINIVGVEVLSPNGNGWISLNVHAGIYNLLNLCNGKDTLLASGQVTAGTISQVRFILATSGNTVVVNNIQYPLQISSTLETGIVVQTSNVISNNNITNVIVDFDAGMSVISGGGVYVLRPVIRTTTSSTNAGITGTISPSTSQIAILAINGADTAVSYSNTSTGNFEIQGLASGVYNVVVSPRAPYSNTTVTGVVVVSGQFTSVGSITLH